MMRGRPRAEVVAACLAIAVTLAGCGEDSDDSSSSDEGTSTDAAEQFIRDFIEAGTTVERLSTEDFQETLGCNWMTAWREDYTIDSIEFDPDGSSGGELDADVDIDLSAYHGVVVFDLVESDGSWPIDQVDAM